MSQSFPTFDRPLDVLHVDDEPMNLRVVDEILKAFSHNAVAAGSGAEALEHLGRQSFDVVLMDIHMPGLSGIQVVERLRASAGAERDTPVIALTADVFTLRPEDYRKLGFDDFISKPILVSGLMNAIAKAVAAPRGSIQAAISRIA